MGWGEGGNTAFPRRAVQPQQKEMGRRAAGLTGRFGEVVLAD